MCGTPYLVGPKLWQYYSLWEGLFLQYCHFIICTSRGCVLEESSLLCCYCWSNIIFFSTPIRSSVPLTYIKRLGVLPVFANLHYPRTTTNFFDNAQVNINSAGLIPRGMGASFERVFFYIADSLIISKSFTSRKLRSLIFQIFGSPRPNNTFFNDFPNVAPTRKLYFSIFQFFGGFTNTFF